MGCVSSLVDGSKPETQARQQAELAKAEAKALNQHYIQPDGMDDMGDWMEAQELDKALAAGRMQAQIGGRS